MYLKLATLDHYGEIQDMVRKFAEHSPYTKEEFDEAKVTDLIIEFIERPIDKIIILAMDEDKAVGMVAATITEFMFNRDRIASELIWWMEPDYRNSRISLELVEAYEFWAKKLNCKLITLSTVETEQAERIAKFYFRRGYKLSERNYVKEL